MVMMNPAEAAASAGRSDEDRTTGVEAASMRDDDGARGLQKPARCPQGEEHDSRLVTVRRGPSSRSCNPAETGWMMLSSSAE